MAMVPKLHRRWNRFSSAAIRQSNFGELAVFKGEKSRKYESRSGLGYDGQPLARSTGRIPRIPSPDRRNCQ